MFIACSPSAVPPLTPCLRLNAKRHYCYAATLHICAAQEKSDGAFVHNFPQTTFQNRRTVAKSLSTGGLAEWSNAAVLKTVGRESVPRVRIPEPPPFHLCDGSGAARCGV